MVVGALSGDVWKIVSFSIYGTTLVLLYSFSTLYHNAAHGKVKRLLQKLDHNSIYLLIAGSYTPFTLVSLRGSWGWSLFGMIWGLALVGISQEVWLKQKTRWVSLTIYLLMGWAAVVAVVPLAAALSWSGFVWLAAGGVAYTVGAVIYSIKKISFNHAIFHIFVLIGSISHFIAVYFYVLPANVSPLP